MLTPMLEAIRKLALLFLLFIFLAPASAADFSL